MQSCISVPQLCPALGTRTSRYLVCGMLMHAQWGSSSGDAIANPISEALNLQIVLVMMLFSYALSCFDLFVILRSMKTSLISVPLQVVRGPQFPQGLEAPSSSGGPGRCAQGFAGRSRKTSIRAEIDHQISRRSS